MNSRLKLLLILLLPALSFALSECSVVVAPEPRDPDKVAQLGRQIFFDASLSNPTGQSCASCHTAATGFSDPSHALISPGIIQGLFGNRNAPSIGYSIYSPPLHYSGEDGTWIGGFFYDGRVNTLEDQAKQPFLNPLEMNDSDKAMVVAKTKQASYFNLFVDLFGNTDNVDSAFDHIAEAIAAFERTPELHPFTSKYDYYLKNEATLTDQEMRGLKLFQDTAKAKCANCHITDPDPASGKVLFTDFTYDNIGVPRNSNSPFYRIPLSYNPEGSSYTDRGLGGFLNDLGFDGQFKVPSLRNVAVSAPYFHNGFFDKLENVVHWYNTRDSATKAGGYPPPEIPGHVNDEELGNLHLTADEEEAIVAFLNTLTDGYK